MTKTQEGISAIVDMVAGSEVLDQKERENLVRMLERAAHRGADTDILIEECKALLA